MALRAPWEDRYYVTHQETSISTAGTFTSPTGKGFTAGNYALATRNHPHLEHGQQIVDQRKATGLAQRRAGAGFEYQQTRKEPGVTLEFDASAYELVPFCWALFQTGASQAGATPITYTFVPYTNPAMETWLSVFRTMSASGADSHRLDGAICRTLTLEARDQGPLVVTAELIGYDVTTNLDASAIVTQTGWASKAPLLWRDAGATLGTYVAATPIGIEGFRLSISNNAAGVYYDDQRPQKFVMGDFTVTGEIVVPWASATVGTNTQLTNFVNGTQSRLRVLWGSFGATADTELYIEVNMRYTGATIEGDVETGVTLPFEHAYDGTTDFAMVMSTTFTHAIP